MKPLAELNFAGGFLFFRMYFNRDGQNKFGRVTYGFGKILRQIEA